MREWKKCRSKKVEKSYKEKYGQIINFERRENKVKLQMRHNFLPDTHKSFCRPRNVRQTGILSRITMKGRRSISTEKNKPSER